MIEKISKSKWIFILLHVLSFGVIFFFSSIEPLYADDLGLIKIIEEAEMPLLKFAAKHSWEFYKNWSGGCIYNFVLVVMIGSKRIWFFIINSATYVLFEMLIYFFAYPICKETGYRLKVNNFVLSFILCALWFFIPTFGGLVIWETGSIAYLWPSVFVFLYIYVYYLRLVNMHLFSEHNKISTVIIMIIIGFLAGGTLETCSCTIMFTSLIWAIYMKWKREKIYIYELAGIFAAFLGGAFLLLAPGNFVRSGGIIEAENMFIKYGWRIARETYYAVKYLTLPSAILGGIIMVNHNNSSIRKWISDNVGESLFMMMAFVGTYVMTFSAGHSIRVMIFPVTLMIIAIVVAYIRREKYINKRVICALVCGLLIYTSFTVTTAAIRCVQSGEPLQIDIDYNAGERPYNLF